MNLGLITQDFPPEVGGIQTYTTELAKRFVKKCDHFLVIAPTKHGAQQIDQALPYPIHRVASSNPFLGFNAMFEAPALFYSYGIQQVFHTQWQTLPASVFARKQGVVKKIFVAAHARELLFNPFYTKAGARQCYEKYKRWLLSHVDLFFPVSLYTADVLKSHGVEQERIKIVINGTDPDQFYPMNTVLARQSIGIKANKILLTITRLVSRKGIDTALRAFKDVLKKHPDSYYVIVGDGQQKKQLEILAKELRISEAVRFVGRVLHKDLINYYNACDVFVMPSKTKVPNVEGFGIVFLEANACRKPVIGTFSGGIPSAVVNGETGILVEEDNPKLLARAIDNLFENEERASEMGRKGRLRVEMDANWDTVANKLMGHIKNKI